MTEVYKLTYIEKPDYNKLKTLFTNQLKNRDPTKSLEWLSSVQSRKVLDLLPFLYCKAEIYLGPQRPPSEDVDERSYKDSVPVKKRRVAPREEDKVRLPQICAALDVISRFTSVVFGSHSSRPNQEGCHEG